MAINLSPENQKAVQASIQRFALEEFGESLGELRAAAFLSFCLKEIGPAIYNQAIADAQACMQERVTDLENICFAEQENYWKQEDKRGVTRKPERR